MLRVVEDLGDAARLDDLPLRHDADPVRHLAHDAQIMGDEQHRHAHALFQIGEQGENLGLHSDVECRGWARRR